MPTYTFQCRFCERRLEQYRKVDERDAPAICEHCGMRTAERVFTPTANVFVAEHFRKLQSDFLPPKGDPSWEHLGRNDQIHEPREEGETLKDHLKREFLSG